MDIVLRPVEPSEISTAIDLLGYLNPETPIETVGARLQTILMDHPHYTLIGAFLDQVLVGVSGSWIGTRVWSGKYLEIDNLVVHPEYRSRNIGTKLIEYLERVAKENKCEFMMLDTYTSYHRAHRLYHRLGFGIWAFHFIKQLVGK